MVIPDDDRGTGESSVDRHGFVAASARLGARADVLLSALQIAQVAAHVGVVVLDLTTMERWNSEEIARIWGYPEGAQLTVQEALSHVHPDDLSRQRENLDALIAGSGLRESCFRILRRGGGERTLRTFPSVTEIAGARLAVVAVWDVTDQVEVDRLRANAEGALKVLHFGSRVLISAESEQALLDGICLAAVQAGGHRLAWYGRAEPGSDRRVVPVASAGDDAVYPWTIEVTWGDAESAQGPTGRSIRTRTVQVADDLLADPRYARWRTAAEEHGFRSSISLPVMVDGVVDGALSVYAGEPDAFTAGAIDLLRELAEAIGFGVATRRRASRLADALDANAEAERARLALLEDLVDVTMRERSRLAMSLHDEPLQRIAAALLYLDSLDGDVVPAQVRTRLAAVSDILRTTSDLLRNVLFDLAPPELLQEGIESALSAGAEWLFRSATTSVTVEVDLDDELEDREARLIYRIALEALTNARRHASATRVRVSLIADGTSCLLRVEDDGAGFVVGDEL